MGKGLNSHSRRRAHGMPGQTMAEFALAMPVMIILIFGMVMAGFYAFRAASADWGVFITGVATGSYNTPATGQARQTVLWQDIRGRLNAAQNRPRTVRSMIIINDSRSWIFGIHLIEAQRGTSWFRLWRFYPGPPPAGGFQ